MKVRHKSPNSIPIFIGLFVLLIGVAQITALWSLHKAIFPQTNDSLVELDSAQLQPQLYWLEVVDNRIQLIPQKTFFSGVTSPEIALKKAFHDLLEQSPNSELTTTIPQGTKLLDLQLSDRGVYIDLSRNFSQGGGSSSMIYRVAQVLYTATSLNPQERVFLSIEGKPLNEEYPLGGEGLVLSYPLTRTEFSHNFSRD